MEANNNKKNIIGVIIQGGAVAIALITIYFMYDLASNHISENTKVQIKLEAAVGKLESAIDRSTEVDRDQIRVLENLERVIQIKIK